MFFDWSRLQLSEGLFVQFQFSVRIRVHPTKKLYLFLESFERKEDILLQFYVSSRLQRNGNNDKLLQRCDKTLSHVIE